MILKMRVFSLSMMVALLAAGASSQEYEKVGTIQSVSGIVFLHSILATKPNEEILLRPGGSVLRDLFEKDTLRFKGPGEVLVIMTNGNVRKFAQKDGTIQLLPERALTAEQKKVEDAIKRFGMAGGSRGIGSLVWWPATGSAVRAQNFQVKWNPPSAPERFTLTLSVEGEKVWSLKDVDSAQGGLSAEQNAEMRSLLVQHQSDEDTQSAIVTISSEMQGSARTSFLILSKGEEAQVTRDLEQWNKTVDDPLLRTIGRTDTLRSAELSCELAEEYDAGLKLAPDSEALLRAALAVNQTIGNSIRSHELRERLRAALSEDPQSNAP